MRKNDARFGVVYKFSLKVVGVEGCSSCGKFITKKQTRTDYDRYRKSKTLYCSKKCAKTYTYKIISQKRTIVKDWMQENQGKHKCWVCKKAVYITEHYKYLGIPKTCASKGCLSIQAKQVGSKYDKLRNLTRYCQCPKCREVGNSEETRIDLKVYSSRAFSKNQDLINYKLTYKKGHNQFGVIKGRGKTTCLNCSEEFKVNPTVKIHKVGLCSVDCRKEHLVKVSKLGKISKLLSGEISWEMKLSYSEGQPKTVKDTVYVPHSCYGCGETKYVRPEVLFREQERTKLNYLLNFWGKCRIEVKRKRWCWCGTKRSGRKGSTVCQRHTHHNERDKKFLKGIIQMTTSTKSTNEIVNILIEKIHLMIQKKREFEGEQIVCMIELEKLEAEKYMKVYHTFAELIEGEFNWGEIKFKSAKNMLMSYGAGKYKEYGREALQCISRLNDNGQGEVFGKISDYKNKKRKVPGYGVVSKWVRDVSGQVSTGSTGSKVVDIKKQYYEALEEINKLNKIVRTQASEISRLAIMISGNKKQG